MQADQLCCSTLNCSCLLAAQPALVLCLQLGLQLALCGTFSWAALPLQPVGPAHLSRGGQLQPSNATWNKLLVSGCLIQLVFNARYLHLKVAGRNLQKISEHLARINNHYIKGRHIISEK